MSKHALCARASNRPLLYNDYARITRTMGVVGMRLLHNDDKLSIAATPRSTMFSFCTGGRNFWLGINFGPATSSQVDSLQAFSTTIAEHLPLFFLFENTLVYLINVLHKLFFFENFYPGWYFQILYLLICRLRLPPIWKEYAYFGHFQPNLSLEIL